MIDKFTDIYILTPENIIIYKQFKLIFMKHQCFYKQQLLLIEKDGRSMLYRLPLLGKEISLLSELTPVDFISAPQKRILVDEDTELLITDEDICTLTGEKLLHAPNLTDVQIMQKHNITVVYAENSAEKCKEIILFLDGTLLLHEKCQEISISDYYFALLNNDEWVVMDWCGNVKNVAYPVKKDELCIQGRFLIKTGTAKYELYSLKEGKVLQTNLNVVLCSTTHDFAICAAIGRDLQVYSDGKWYNFGEVGFFDILDNISAFYVQKNGKYFVYGYDAGCQPYFSEEFVKGVDFVSYDAKSRTLMWFNNGKIHTRAFSDFL